MALKLKKGVAKKDPTKELINARNEGDIAPLRQDSGLDFFKESESDNVIGTILGTTADVGTGVVKGVAKTVGGIADLGLYGIAGLADVLGYDEFAEKTKRKAQENTIDDAFAGWDEFIDKYSVLGTTSDAIAEGLGQVASIILTGGAGTAAGLGKVGTSLLTSGVLGASSFGSGITEAYEGGATDEEAARYGFTQGVIDAASEAFFGGLGKAVKAVGISKGLSSLDDVFAKMLSDKLSNRLAKTLVQYGVKAGAEGFEELIAGVGSIVNKKITYMSEAEWKELIEDENLLEQFIVGAVTSGVAQSGIVPGMRSGSLVESVREGRDFITGLSANEQKVVDKVYSDKVETLRKIQGGEPTNKQKNKLQEDAINAVKNGDVSVDIIESALGGDIYRSYEMAKQQYEDRYANEDALLKELNDLRSKPNGELNDFETARREELKAMGLGDESAKKSAQNDLNEIKERLSEEVDKLTVNDRFIRDSYLKKDANLVKSIDEQGKTPYNENDIKQESTKGETYARTDEFRNLQTESQRMSDEEWNFYLRGGENETVRRRVSAVLQRQMDTFRSSGGSYDGVLKLSGKGNQFNIYEGVSPSLFHDVFEVSRKYLRNGELVDLHSLETTEDGIGYNDCYNYLSEDGLSGFSITPDGDLISVFNAGEKAGFLRAISDVVKAKAKTLDCYVSPNQNLMEMYQKTFGFKTASIMDYNMEYDHDNIAENHDSPKVAFMVNTENDVETREFTEDEYDEAVEYRNSFVNQATANEVAFFAPKKSTVNDVAPTKAADTTNEAPTAKIVDAAPMPKRKNRILSKAVSYLVDKGAVFERISRETGNDELQSKWNYTLSSNARAQWLMQNGAEGGVKPLKDINDRLKKSGLTEQFNEYIYNLLNVDRMTLADRYEGAKNKPVFGDEITADVSRKKAEKLEKEHPEFKAIAQDVYNYMNYLRKLMVDNGVISKETADLWAEMYPHYVPISRIGKNNKAVSVPLETYKTGIGAPVKSATGGSGNFQPLLETMAMRTEQTYRAIARNSFGLELMKTLNAEATEGSTSVDNAVDLVETQDNLAQKGNDFNSPTFTVFKDGKRQTFNVTEEMYDALKPAGVLGETFAPVAKFNEFRRGLLTEYNPTFLLTNAIKDVQDIILNSQHPVKTYSKLPKAFKELSSKGKFYTEYMENGGGDVTYFDRQSNTFTEDPTGIKKWLNGLSKANNFIERAPRLAEYIASREAGNSIETSMLHAARVTTNFAAGGDMTKFLNRNGATFLNASVQGAAQQVRNIAEAKRNGLKGWVGLATKFAAAGLPAVLLNRLLWEDDEEYADLSDYVKQNYYVIAKFGDGQFLRIPKGRALAVIQDAVNQTVDSLTGEDDIDFESFLELAVSNLAPNNPLDNNIIAPVVQAITNKTWYGEDLVPTRLQDEPKAEQYDESTDAISKWLGEALAGTPFEVSPYKVNYLLDQYSGAIGDLLLPVMTPEAERGSGSVGGVLTAPLVDKFTADATLNNQSVSDFYDKVDELASKANSAKATEEDILKYKYISSVRSEIGKLYAEKREKQNEHIPNDVKFADVRNIQKQINDTAKESLEAYNNVMVTDTFAAVGDRYYKRNKSGEWTKIDDDELKNIETVTRGLDMEIPEYMQYKTVISQFNAKDENGNSVSGLKKQRVHDYIYGLPLDNMAKAILYKSEYNSYDDENIEIIEYLNGRDDVTYSEMEEILTGLGFKVSPTGSITW